jgi:hypothetical protein
MIADLMLVAMLRLLAVAAVLIVLGVIDMMRSR